MIWSLFSGHTPFPSLEAATPFLSSGLPPYSISRSITFHFTIGLIVTRWFVAEVIFLVVCFCCARPTTAPIIYKIVTFILKHTQWEHMSQMFDVHYVLALDGLR
jgi:hypothetical protein